MNMKCGGLYLSLLPSAALAFQQAANNNIVTPLYHRRATTTALHIVPERFERAQHCATHYGSCDVEEMEELANGMCMKEEVDINRLPNTPNTAADI